MAAPEAVVKTISGGIRRWFLSMNPWLVLLLGVWLVLGAILADDFGESWDEQGTSQYGAATLRSFLTLTPPEHTFGGLEHYGPFFLALTEAAISVARGAGLTWEPYQIRHLAYFLTLPTAVVAVYLLSRRWARPPAALAAAALLATQPLLFGHSFMNPKDTPFLALFAVAMAAGVAAVDRIPAVEESRPRGCQLRGLDQEGTHPVVSDWQAARLWLRWVLGITVASALIVTLELLVFHSTVLPLLESNVRQAYEGRASPLLNRWFDSVAQRRESEGVEAYVVKARGLYFTYGRHVVLAAWLVACLLAFRTFPVTACKARHRWLPGGMPVAGVCLGLAMSVRPGAALAGALVGLYMFLRHRRKALAPLIGYALVAVAVCYATWPWLWGHPLSRIGEAIRSVAELDSNNQMLYAGHVYVIRNAPWHFAIVFPWIQITVPLWLMGVAGMLSLTRNRDGRTASLAAVLLLWMVLPPAVAALVRYDLYDNARHLLFATTPAFVFAARAFDALWRRWTSIAGRAIAMIVLLFPGLLAIFRLHPYEYIYFNPIVGGVRGAFRSYELDYWGLSYRETTAFLNREASPNASIVVLEPTHLFFLYAREDLKLAVMDPASPAGDPTPEFLMSTTRVNQDLEVDPSAPVVFRVEVDGATLAIVKKTP